MNCMSFWGKSLLLVCATTIGVPVAIAKETLPSQQEFNNVTLPPIYIEQTIKLNKKETLIQALSNTMLPYKMVSKALQPLQKKFNVRGLRPGQEINFRYKEAKDGSIAYIDEIMLYSRDDKKVKSYWDNGKYAAKVDKRLVEKRQIAVTGTIEGSLYSSAEAAGMPVALVTPFANLFAWDIDFTRDIRSGNEFSIVYESIYDENGDFLRSGNILAAKLETRKKTFDAYRMEVKGRPEYYNAKGYNKRRALLRTPLEFGRVSSHFNPNRKHPVLGYKRAHRGTDFAAPTGTPIKAAGDGVIERSNWYGSFGRYVRIKHDSKYKTAYAHLSRFAKGMRKGKRVRQGQVIGYVGTSGRSTGPHLHFEVHKKGKKVNPMKVALPSGKKIPSKIKPKFKQLVASTNNLWKQVSNTLVAQK